MTQPAVQREKVRYEAICEVDAELYREYLKYRGKDDTYISWLERSYLRALD